MWINPIALCVISVYVRRNVALPGWLNYEAEHAGINVSRVLQEALMDVLNVKRTI